MAFFHDEETISPSQNLNAHFKKRMWIIAKMLSF